MMLKYVQFLLIVGLFACLIWGCSEEKNPMWVLESGEPPVVIMRFASDEESCQKFRKDFISATFDAKIETPALKPCRQLEGR